MVEPTIETPFGGSSDVSVASSSPNNQREGGGGMKRTLAIVATALAVVVGGTPSAMAGVAPQSEPIPCVLRPWC